MSLEAGQKLAHYEILEPIGRGGMGEVYRAKDSKLGRDVAIKVLPDEFAQDEERLRRFQREAKVLASLNHPNIAAIYGLEREGDTHYLVLELVPGETLADRISRGPIPLEEALEVAKKIAEALEEAHERGIVHRDLKPANVKLTPDDKVKVLDFGLAKAFAEEAVEGDAAASMSPTITRDATREGVILGTAAYMSPEQAKGKRVDKRTDIFAFGAVLYEMLTSRRAFAGEGASEVLAAVITLEPDWDAVPTAQVRELLQRCLAKDTKQRLRDMGDVRYELDRAMNTGPQPTRAGSAIVSSRLFPAALLVVITGTTIVVGGIALRGPRTDVWPAGGVTRFVIEAGRGSPGGYALAFSPDGSSLVFAGYSGYSENSGLHLRTLDAYEWVPIAGTEDGAAYPVFSPDGRRVAFLDVKARAIKTVAVSGGAPVTVYSHEERDPSLRIEKWNDDDQIMFRTSEGYYRVGASGGAPEAILLFPDGQDSVPSRPSELPNGALLYSVLDASTHKVVVQPVGSSTYQELFPGQAPKYLSTGHIVFNREGSLWAVPFDDQRMRVAGDLVPLPIALDGNDFDVSGNGTLAYVGDRFLKGEQRLVWVDRDGATEPLLDEHEAFGTPRLSPDNSLLAVGVFSTDEPSIWVYDLNRGTRTRLTAAGSAMDPEWAPDGKSVLFSWTPEGAASRDIYSRRADGSGGVELVESSALDLFQPQPSPDGHTLAYVDIPGRDIWVVSTGGEATRFVGDDFEEHSPVFSPDGRYLVFVSDESGRAEVYAASLPDGHDRWTVSTEGGTEPMWSRDGHEIFYRNGDQVMAVPVESDPKFRLGSAQVLFEGRFHFAPDPRNYDVSLDGQRFVMVEGGEDVTSINVVLNWTSELERLVPTNN